MHFRQLHDSLRRRRKSNATDGTAKPAAAGTAEASSLSLRGAGLDVAVAGVAFSMSPDAALYVPLTNAGRNGGKIGQRTYRPAANRASLHEVILVLAQTTMLYACTKCCTYAPMLNE